MTLGKKCRIYTREVRYKTKPYELVASTLQSCGLPEFLTDRVLAAQPLHKTLDKLRDQTGGINTQITISFINDSFFMKHTNLFVEFCELRLLSDEECKRNKSGCNETTLAIPSDPKLWADKSSVHGEWCVFWKDNEIAKDFVNVYKTQRKDAMDKIKTRSSVHYTTLYLWFWLRVNYLLYLIKYSKAADALFVTASNIHLLQQHSNNNHLSKSNAAQISKASATTNYSKQRQQQESIRNAVNANKHQQLIETKQRNTWTGLSIAMKAQLKQMFCRCITPMLEIEKLDKAFRHNVPSRELLYRKGQIVEAHLKCILELENIFDSYVGDPPEIIYDYIFAESSKYKEMHILSRAIYYSGLPTQEHTQILAFLKEYNSPNTVAFNNSQASIFFELFGEDDGDKDENASALISAFKHATQNAFKYSVSLASIYTVFHLRERYFATRELYFHASLWKHIAMFHYVLEHKIPSDEYIQNDPKHCVLLPDVLGNCVVDDLPDYGYLLPNVGSDDFTSDNYKQSTKSAQAMFCENPKSRTKDEEEHIQAATMGSRLKTTGHSVITQILGCAFPYHCQIRPMPELISKNYRNNKMLRSWFDKCFICNIMALYEHDDSKNRYRLFGPEATTNNKEHNDDNVEPPNKKRRLEDVGNNDSNCNFVGLHRMLCFYREFVLNKNRANCIDNLCKNKQVVRCIVQEYVVQLLKTHPVLYHFLTKIEGLPAEIELPKNATSQNTTGTTKIPLTLGNFLFCVHSNSNVFRLYYHEVGKIPGPSKDQNNNNKKFDKQWYAFTRSRKWYDTRLQRKFSPMDTKLNEAINSLFSKMYAMEMMFNGKPPVDILAKPDKAQLALITEYCVNTRFISLENDSRREWIQVLKKCGVTDKDCEVYNELLSLHYARQTPSKFTECMWRLTRNGVRLLMNLVHQKRKTEHVQFIPLDRVQTMQQRDAILLSSDLDYCVNMSSFAWTECCDRPCNFFVPKQKGFFKITHKLQPNCTEVKPTCIKLHKERDLTKKRIRYRFFEAASQEKLRDVIQRMFGPQPSWLYTKYKLVLCGRYIGLSDERNVTNAIKNITGSSAIQYKPPPWLLQYHAQQLRIASNTDAMQQQDEEQEDNKFIRLDSNEDLPIEEEIVTEGALEQQAVVIQSRNKKVQSWKLFIRDRAKSLLNKFNEAEDKFNKHKEPKRSKVTDGGDSDTLLEKKRTRKKKAEDNPFVEPTPTNMNRCLTFKLALKHVHAVLSQDLKSFLKKQSKRLLWENFHYPSNRNVNIVNALGYIVLFRDKDDHYIQFRSCCNCGEIRHYDHRGWTHQGYVCLHCINAMREIRGLPPLYLSVSPKKKKHTEHIVMFNPAVRYIRTMCFDYNTEGFPMINVRQHETVVSIVNKHA